MLLHCILTGLLRLVVQLLQDGHHVLALLAVVLGICGGENIPSWQFSTSGGISIDRDIIVSLQKSTARFSFLALSLSNIFLLTFSIWSLISITFGSVSQSRISSSSNMSPGKLQKRPCVSYQLSHLSPEINRAQSRKKKVAYNSSKQRDSEVKAGAGALSAVVDIAPRAPDSELLNFQPSPHLVAQSKRKVKYFPNKNKASKTRRRRLHFPYSSSQLISPSYLT